MTEVHDLLERLKEPERDPNIWWKVACCCFALAALVAIVSLSWVSYVGNPAVRHQNSLSQCRTNISANEAVALDDLVISLTTQDRAAYKENVARLEAASDARRRINDICN